VVRLLEDTDDCCRIAEHLVFQTELLLPLVVGCEPLDLVKDGHFEEIRSSRAVSDLLEVCPREVQVEGLTRVFRLGFEEELQGTELLSAHQLRCEDQGVAIDFLGG